MAPKPKPTIKEKGRKTPLTVTKKPSTKYSPTPMSAAAKKKAAAAGKATGAKTKPKSTVSKIAKEAKTMARSASNTASGFKQGLKGVDFTKEIPKYVGGAVKANLQLPGTVAKMVKRNTKQTVNEFKKGFNKK